jgi:hypothetical protein
VAISGLLALVSGNAVVSGNAAYANGQIMGFVLGVVKFGVGLYYAIKG